jgi:hypothetical protein
MTYAESIRRAYDAATSEQRERGIAWYADYSQRLYTLADAANVPFAAACGIVAVSSINTRPEPGLRWTSEVMNGRKGGHLPIAVERAAHILDAAEELDFDGARDLACSPESDARKVRNFGCNVYTMGQPCEHGTACVTIDRWAHYVATDGARKDVPSGKMYDRIADAYREVAAELGMAPAILQAIVWVTVAE